MSGIVYSKKNRHYYNIIFSMKRHFTILAIALFLCIGLQAKERTTEQKRQIALSVLNKNAATRAVSAGNLKELKTMKELTVVGYSDAEGFAIISNDDNNEAVLGWSDKKFNPDEMPDGLIWWLNTANEVLSTKESYTRNLTPAKIGDGTYPESVESFVTAKWGQEAPYNQQCPLMNGKRALTGCVATAAAQIMFYYGYPTQGAGETVFDPVSFDFVDFANTTYDYANMIPVYGKDYTTQQASAVATLMHHLGVATSMNYGTDASGAYSYKAASAWREHFSYSTRFYKRDAYKQEEWMAIIYEELANKRPIQYGGVDEKSGGHSFVFDGYDADGLVHVNWGWEGISDGYYDVALLDPENYSYKSQQEMIVMHTPDAPAIPYMSQWGIINDGNFTIEAYGNRITYIATNFVNIDCDLFKGKIGLLAKSASDGTVYVVDEKTLTDNSGNESETGYLDGYSQYGYQNVSTSSLPEGTYYVYMASKATSETDWQPIHGNESVTTMYTLTKSGNNIDVTATGICQAVTTESNIGINDNRIYSIDGQYVGNDASKLGKGLYIKNGEKFLKK